MTIRHRRWHLTLWLIVAPLVGTLLILSLVLRGEVTP